MAVRIGCALFLLVATVQPHAATLSEAERQIYAPSRQIDILNLALDITPDFSQRRFTGVAALRFKPIAKPLEELRLDSVDLQVSAVTATENILGWQATDKEVVITFASGIPADQEVEVTIRYAATPKQGMYFRTPELGYCAEDMHLFTQGEAIESRYWFPCFDAPNEKFTSEVTCRVPAGMVVLSNGRLVSETKDPATGLVAVRWIQDKPHSGYLIALAAGYFSKVEDRYKDVPLAFYVPASQIQQAASSFADTPDMMEFFEREIGVPYPWAKYYQVCVEDFTAGGMENTSLTILNTSTLHTADFETLRDSHGLVAHELVHQWFGDYVTCKDWANVWLNEGFATYYEALYEGHRLGRDQLLYQLYGSARQIVSRDNETNAIVRRNFNNPDEQFSYLTYPKGGWILHMLRSQLGEDLYRRCVKTYLVRHPFGTVVTEDLNRIIEEFSGRSFDRFFDQWVFHAGQPELSIDYSWNERTKLAKLSIQQTVKPADGAMLFELPLPVRFKTKAGTTAHQVFVKNRSEDFYLPLPAAPEVVQIDPDLTVLARIQFNPPRAMLEAQLADPTNLVGRLIAVDKLSGKRDALNPLKAALNHDPFYGVRLAASRAIAAIQTDESLQALLASTNQPDARVRRQVTSDIAGYYQDKACAALLDIAVKEKNPDIRARAISTLGAYAKTEIHERLLEWLKTPSYHNVLADAAIAAMRGQDDASYVTPLLEQLKEKPAAYTTSGFSRALDTLAWLSRNEQNKDAAREFLLIQLNNKKERVNYAAIRALGTLGDPKAIAALETLAHAPKESRERNDAENAINTLRDVRKPSVELRTLRSDVLNLQRDNRELKKDVEDLKKKLDTLTEPAAATKPPPGKPAKPGPKPKSSK
jgi:aminopeptidase N